LLIDEDDCEADYNNEKILEEYDSRLDSTIASTSVEFIPKGQESVMDDNEYDISENLIDNEYSVSDLITDTISVRYYLRIYVSIYYYNYLFILILLSLFIYFNIIIGTR
jgi:hypothetical protein